MATAVMAFPDEEGMRRLVDDSAEHSIAVGWPVRVMGRRGPEPVRCSWFEEESSIVQKRR